MAFKKKKCLELEKPKTQIACCVVKKAQNLRTFFIGSSWIMSQKKSLSAFLRLSFFEKTKKTILLS